MECVNAEVVALGRKKALAKVGACGKEAVVNPEGERMVVSGHKGAKEVTCRS